MIGLIHDLPKDKDGSQSQTPNLGGGILQKIALVTIPLLNLHLQVLGTIKNGIAGHKPDVPGKPGSINEDNLIKHFHHFAMFQLHALRMLVDPAGRLQGVIDIEHDEKLKMEIQAISEKVAAGSVSMIEAQEKVIQSIIEILNKLKKGKPAPGPTSAY
jgi:hypothetical protein